MISPLDPFAERFDSIDIDRTRAPKAAVFDEALAEAAKPAPGFYLVDDSQGRFVVDRDLGVVSLKDAALLDTERDAIHTARLKVVEQSGAVYELELRLRLTGLVPQVADADEFAALAGLGASALVDAPAPPVVDEPATTTIEPAAPEPAPLDWIECFVAAGRVGAIDALDEQATFGALVRAPAPAVSLPDATLNLDDALPTPTLRGADWSL